MDQFHLAGLYVVGDQARDHLQEDSGAVRALVIGEEFAR